MTLQKIYIHLVDGTDVWVLINAKLIQDAQFEIIETDEYKELDAKGLFEFYPGDVVELGDHILTDGTKRQVAKKLISKGKWPDRKYYEFNYKATLNQLTIDKQTAQIFHNEIERIKKEI